MKIEFFRRPSDFRAWLRANYAKEPELAVGFYKKSSGKPSVTYSEAVEEALCFGWIDGVRNSIDAETYKVRFTPRKPKSQWSAVNIGRVRKLMEQGKMASAGRAAFAGAETRTRAYSYEQRNTKARRRQRASFPCTQNTLGVLPSTTSLVPPHRYLVGNQR